MTRSVLGDRTGSGSSCTTSNTSYIGDDVVGGATVPLGAVGAFHGVTATRAAETAKIPSPVPGTNANHKELESERHMEFQDDGKDLKTVRHHENQPQPAAAAARVFSPFRPSSATASASFSLLSKGASSNSKTDSEYMPPNTSESNLPKAHSLSNEAIEAAIQAAIAGSSHSSGSDLHSSMRKRSVASSTGSGSGYASERSDRGERDAGSGREGKASGSDSGKSHGPGGYGSGGDARSVPPRDTRTLLFVGNASAHFHIRYVTFAYVESFHSYHTEFVGKT
jgi:hypothetical protein